MINGCVRTKRGCKNLECREIVSQIFKKQKGEFTVILLQYYHKFIG